MVGVASVYLKPGCHKQDYFPKIRSARVLKLPFVGITEGYIHPPDQVAHQYPVKRY